MLLPAYLVAGTYYCVGRPKLAYRTWWQARLRSLWAATEKKVYLDEYECPLCGGWHVYNLTKEIAHQVAYGAASNTRDPVAVAELIARARRVKLAGQGVEVRGADPTGGTPTPREDPDLEGRRKAERRKFERELARLLSGVLHGHHVRYDGRRVLHRRRRRRPWFIYRYRGGRPEARVGYPRGGTVTKMLGYWNGLRDERDNALRGGLGANELLRRRNRARERESTRAEVLDGSTEYLELNYPNGVDVGCGRDL